MPGPRPRATRRLHDASHHDRIRPHHHGLEPHHHGRRQHLGTHHHDPTRPLRDLGVTPDFGDADPIGCNGKIDLLFVLSRNSNMRFLQEQLVAAFPQFIATIESKFADFDYHIMVVDGDNSWGEPVCTTLWCPEQTCRFGDDCCPFEDPMLVGEPCCGASNYPCQDLDLVKQCDWTWGAGTVFPAGKYTQNRRCPIDKARRYLVKGQTDIFSTFECIATIGNSGWDSLGQALTAAVQQPINAIGGCNQGFLRDDALLMVTLISSNPDEVSDSEGSVSEWAKAVTDAKYGDDKSVVMLNFLNTDSQWKPSDRIGTLAKIFPYHHLEDALAPDYGPAFLEAANLVETACAGFKPPG